MQGQFHCGQGPSHVQARSRSGIQVASRARTSLGERHMRFGGSSHPARERSRTKVVIVGDFRPCSYADSVVARSLHDALVLPRVSPELIRTRSSSSDASIIYLAYLIRYVSDQIPAVRPAQ